MNDADAVKEESEALFGLVKRRYGDRLTPDTLDGLRAAVETVAKTVVALRSVKLEYRDEPLVLFTPFRKDA